jgi:predicted alpha/beta-fold hydrolase
VVAKVHTRYPDAKVTAAGYSLGASYLTKYVGEEGDQCTLVGAAAFACPLDLVAMSDGTVLFPL